MGWLIMVPPLVVVCCYPVAVPCENFAWRSRLVFCRPLPLVQVAPSATGGAPFTPQIFTGFDSSKGISNKKSAIPDGMTDFLELLARFELATSSLPRMRSTGWAIAAYALGQLCHYISVNGKCQGLFLKKHKICRNTLKAVFRPCKQRNPCNSKGSMIVLL